MGITGSHFETFDFIEERLFRTVLVWRLTLFNRVCSMLVVYYLDYNAFQIWAYKIKLTDKIMTSLRNTEQLGR